MLTKGKSGTWLGVNGDKRAAKQETTMMHQAVVLVPSEKGTAKQETTTSPKHVATPHLLSLGNNDTGKNIKANPTTRERGTHTTQNHPHTNTNTP